jgi:hypothetical protein
MEYTEAVAQAAAALLRGEEANWELARLTYERTLEKRGPAGRVGVVTLEVWAANVGEKAGRTFSTWAAAAYRDVWKRRLESDRSEDESWTESFTAVRPGSGVGPMRERVTERHLFGDDAKPEVKVEIAKRLLADEAVADAVLESDVSREFVYDALARRGRQQHIRYEQKVNADPVARQFAGNEAVLRLDTLLARFARDLEDLFPQLPELGPNDPLAHRAFLTARVAEVLECLSRVQRYIETGRTDVEAFVRGVLREGSHG